MDDRCPRCIHGQRLINKTRMCDAMNLLYPVEYMRHGSSQCGPDAKLFDTAGGEPEELGHG